MSIELQVEEEVVEYRWVQNLVMEKSFQQYEDIFEARQPHYDSKTARIVYRVNDFRFSDWKDLQNDSDVVMGRLLHNRIGIR